MILEFQEIKSTMIVQCMVVAKVLIPGHKKEIMELIRLLLVSRHYYL